MRVGEQARVLRLERETEQDRDDYVEKDGLLVRRLNVPWNPDLGALWEVRFDDGETVVFSESEIAALGPDGEPREQEIDELRAAWDKAPRQVTLPFKRFGAGTGSAPALLAFLVLVLAGVLLVWAGVSAGSLALGGAGGALVLLGILAAAVLVT